MGIVSPSAVSEGGRSRLKNKGEGFPWWLPQCLERFRTPSGTHAGNRALPRMWTKALDTHTKFSKGPLVRVGGSLKALCGWKAGGGGAGRGRDGGCVENRVPRDWGEGAGEGGRGMLRPRASGRGGGAGLSGRLRSRPGWQRDFKGAASAGLRIPGEGRREGAATAFSFFYLTERSRAGWGRRSPFSFSFPLSLSLFKVHFRPTGFVGSLREALPAPSPPVPFLFACSPLWSCRWWLQRVCRYRPKSPGDPGSSENPEVQNARLCS